MRLLCFLVILLQIIYQTQNGCEARGMMVKTAYRPKQIKLGIRRPSGRFGSSVTRHRSRFGNNRFGSGSTRHRSRFGSKSFRKPSTSTYKASSRLGGKLNKYRNIKKNLYSKYRGKKQTNFNRAGKHQSKTNQKTFKQKLKNPTKNTNKEMSNKNLQNKKHKVNGKRKKHQKKYGETHHSDSDGGAGFENNNVDLNEGSKRGSKIKNWFKKDGVGKAFAGSSIVGVGAQLVQMNQDNKRYEKQLADEQKKIDETKEYEEKVKAQYLSDCKSGMAAIINYYIIDCGEDTDFTDKILQTCVTRLTSGLLKTAYDKNDFWMREQRMTALECEMNEFATFENSPSRGSDLDLTTEQQQTGSSA